MIILYLNDGLWLKYQTKSQPNHIYNVSLINSKLILWQDSVAQNIKNQIQVHILSDANIGHDKLILELILDIKYEMNANNWSRETG